MIKFVSDFRQIGGFCSDSGFLSSKTDIHDIAELLLKVALSTITLTLLLPRHGYILSCSGTPTCQLYSISCCYSLIKLCHTCMLYHTVMFCNWYYTAKFDNLISFGFVITIGYWPVTYYHVVSLLRTRDTNKLPRDIYYIILSCSVATTSRLYIVAWCHAMVQL